jgi:RNA recognition motif-containing protein
MTKLFAVGFPREMDEMELAQLFALYGDIELLTIAREQAGGKSKGFGFIQMDDAGAKNAITALNGYAFGDRLLEVRISEDKQPPPTKPSFKPKPDFSPANGPAIKKKRPRINR